MQTVALPLPIVSDYHVPALVRQVVQYLGGAGRVLDCTLGGGGHARALLEQGAQVTGLDRDPAAVAAASATLAAFAAKGQFRTLQANFAEIDSLPELTGERYDGVLLDLGVSSHQLDDPRRGFTFRPGAPLDMRMSPESSRDAAALLNEATELELTLIFKEYGDFSRAARLARAIVRRRKERPFAISDDLVAAIREVLGPRSGPAEFAPVFQALRIAVNDEIGALEQALPRLRDRLNPGGRMAVIAYHSGEDRLVKRAFREWSASCICPPRQPVCTCRGYALGRTLTRKAVVAEAEELASNPRARSARLRVWERAR